MHGPERLWEAAQFSLLEHFFAGMICGETAVVWGVPILCGSHQRKFYLDLICHGYHFAPLRHSQRATRQKIILNINQDESFHLVDLRFLWLSGSAWFCGRASPTPALRDIDAD